MKTTIVIVSLLISIFAHAEYMTLNCEFFKKPNGDLDIDNFGIVTTSELAPGTSFELAVLTVGTMFMGGYRTYARLNVNDDGSIAVTHSYCGVDTFSLCSTYGDHPVKSEVRNISIGEHLTFDASLGFINDGYLVIYYLPTLDEQYQLPYSAREMCDRLAGEQK